MVVVMSGSDQPTGEDGWEIDGVTIGSPPFDGDGDGPDDEDDDDLEVVWDLSDYDDESLDALDAALERAGIPHEWEDDQVLVIGTEHATQAELLVERLDFPMALEALPDGPEGEQAERVLGMLFDAADRLRREPADVRGLAGVVRAAEVAALAPTPFGVAPAEWGGVVRLVEDLRDEVVAERPDHDAVRQLASRLHAAVRPMV